MRAEIAKFLSFPEPSGRTEYRILEEVTGSNFRRQLIEYPGSDGDPVPAFLFIPDRSRPGPGILIHHQHNGERHLGKSEVAGLAGNPLQAFGPALAKEGFVVLAPDSICFEDRRGNYRGTEPAPGEQDWLHHFNELTYRLVQGDTLMRKVLEDASIGLTLLSQLPSVDKNRLGVFGHSYGGNTTLFQAALDERVSFACSSGAACTFSDKMERGTPFEFALVIPGFCKLYDMDDLVKATAPRKLLLVSGSEDKYSRDAEVIFNSALSIYSELGAPNNLQLKKYLGGHPLTQERFDFILEWLARHS